LLHASLAQVLDWAVRLCAVSQLVGLLELAIARRELLPGGFLDWTLIGVLNPKARTGTGSLIRKIFRRIGPRLFNWTLLIDGAVATLLLVRPSAAPLIAIAWIMQLLIMKRHHLTFDGSDHMTLVVLLACLLGRVESDPNAPPSPSSQPKCHLPTWQQGCTRQRPPTGSPARRYPWSCRHECSGESLRHGSSGSIH
jgi:hypothetical protein